MTRYWVVRLGEGGKFVDKARQGKFIALGWNKLGDLGWLNDEQDVEKAREKLSKEYESAYGGSKIGIGIGTGMLWNFIREMKKDDMFLVPDVVGRKVHIGRINSTYKYSEDWNDGCPYQHRKMVQWVKTIDRDEVSPKLKQALNSQLTVFSVDHHKEEIERLLTGVTEAKKTAKDITGDSLATAMLNKLFDLKPQEFEEFTKDLLSIIGFEAATTPYVGDKGVDVIGTLNTDGLTNVTLRVQVKRVKGNLGIEEVLKIRGTLGADEHGAIITTSGFTKQAQEEAQDEKKKIIQLIDGPMLVELILKYYDDLEEKYKKQFGLQHREIPLKDRFMMTSKG